jgi:hypothetical protein
LRFSPSPRLFWCGEIIRAISRWTPSNLLCYHLLTFSICWFFLRII